MASTLALVFKRLYLKGEITKEDYKYITGEAYHE